MVFWVVHYHAGAEGDEEKFYDVRGKDLWHMKLLIADVSAVRERGKPPKTGFVTISRVEQVVGRITSTHRDEMQ